MFYYWISVQSSLFLFKFHLTVPLEPSFLAWSLKFPRPILTTKRVYNYFFRRKEELFKLLYLPFKVNKYRIIS